MRPKPLSTSIGKQVGIYLLSVLVPPLGLVPGFKYVFQNEAKARIVGLVAVILTIISCIVTFYLTIGLIDQIKSQLNAQLGSQLNDQMNNQLLQTIPQTNQLPQ